MHLPTRTSKVIAKRLSTGRDGLPTKTEAVRAAERVVAGR